MDIDLSPHSQTDHSHQVNNQAERTAHLLRRYPSSNQGGISSYATILLLTAFFKHNHHAEPNHHVELNNALPLFSMFLKIFSNQHWTIDVR